MMKGKKGAGGMILVAVIALIAVVAFLGTTGVISLGALSLGGDDAGGDEGAELSAVSCESGTTPAYTLTAYDAENPGSALTEATNLYRKAGDKTWTQFTAGTAFATSFNQDYEIVMGVNTSDMTDNNYGPVFNTGPIPCEETPSDEVAMYVDEVETSLVASFFNADGVASTAEGFVADQSQTVSAKLLTGSDEYFGNPTIPTSDVQSLDSKHRNAYPNMGCMNLNTTEWDAPEKVLFAGEEMNKVSVPQRHSTAASKTTYCYEMPVLTDSLMEENRYFLRLNADATVAPAHDETLSIYAANYFINAEDGEVYWGVEDEDGNAAGTDAADSLTMDFT